MELNNPNESVENQVTNQPEETILDQNQMKPITKTPKKLNWVNLSFGIILSVAVIVLYILHFFSPKEKIFTPKEFTGKPGSGEVVYINLDTINENYELVKVLKGNIEAETKKQEALFQNKEQVFKKKYAQFEENYSKGILTQVQVENAQIQLQQEYSQLEAEKESVFNDLQTKQANALLQLYDSLQVVVKRINTQRNASFVITYQANSPFLIHADPTKEITDQVLFELNRSFKK